jgi:hypothetical protein
MEVWAMEPIDNRDSIAHKGNPHQQVFLAQKQFKSPNYQSSITDYQSQVEPSGYGSAISLQLIGRW